MLVGRSLVLSSPVGHEGARDGAQGGEERGGEEREEAVGGEGTRVNPWPHILTDGVGVGAAGCLTEV